MNWFELASLLLMPLSGAFIAWYLPRQFIREELERERRDR